MRYILFESPLDPRASRVPRIPYLPVSQGSSDLHRERNSPCLFHVSLLFLYAPSTERVIPAGGHLAAQITRAKRPRNDDLSPNGPPRCTAYRFSTPLCHFGFAACFRLVLAFSLCARPSPRKKERRASSLPAKFNFRGLYRICDFHQNLTSC